MHNQLPYVNENGASLRENMEEKKWSKYSAIIQQT